MTFIEKFEYLKKKYALKADTSKLTDSFIAAQITMTDDDCAGTMYAAFINSTFSFEPYDYHDNTVAVIVSSALLEDCIKGKADPAKSYLDGELKAWGNLDHALQLIECLKGKKKAPAEKKTTKRSCKKTAEKTECEAAATAEEVKTEEIAVPAEEKKPAKRCCKKTAAAKEDAPEKATKKATKKTTKEK